MAIGNLGASKVPFKSLAQIGYSEEDLILDAGGRTEIEEAIYIGPDRVRPTRDSGLHPKRPGALDHVIFLFRVGRRDLIVRGYSLYDESGKLKLEPQGAVVTYEGGFKKPAVTWWQFVQDYIKSYKILGKPVESITIFDEDVIPEDDNYRLPKYYNIQLKVAPSSDVGIILDDYTFKGKPLSITMLEDLNRYIISSEFYTIAGYVLPKTSDWDRGLSDRLHFDYNKISDSKEQSNKDKIINDIKTVVENALKGASTTKEGADNPPTYKIVKDEKTNEILSPGHREESDGGSWALTYEIVKAPSPTQSTPPEPAVPPEETPTSPPEEEPPSDTPDQEPPPVEQSTTSPPSGTQSTAQSPEENTPTDTDEQESSREERTGENPSENDKKPEDVERTKGIKNVFPNQKTAQTIKFDLPPDEAYQKDFVESFGNLPFLWYNAYQIEYNHIKNLELSYVDNIPHINVTFRDSLGKMKDEGMPLDDSRISFFLNPRTKLLKPIHLDFKIIDFSENKGIYQIQGFLDVKDLYLKKFKSYPQLTSFGIYKQISKDLGLGFNSNIDDTDDKMTWINTGHKLFEFLNETVRYSYKSDETFLKHYIDFYYHLNYVDLEKELKRDIEKELGVTNTGMEEVTKKLSSETVQKYFLTNDFSAKQSNYYFEKFTIINNATKLALKKGYLTKIKFYDELEKTFLQFDVDALTGEADKKILMRGAPQDEQFFKENVNFKYAGKIDTDNMHKNYYYAYVQNEINLVELDKLGLILELPTPNYNYYKFQKVYVILSNQSNNMARSPLNSRLSGQWMISDIAFTFINSSLRQRIELVKRDLELSPDELKNEGQDNNKQQPNQGQNENNENPTDQETPLPEQPASVGPTASQPEPTGATQSAETPPIIEPSPEPPIEETFPLTKEMWRTIYTGKINPKVIERYYEPMITLLKKNNTTTPDEIAKVLAYINIESNFLTFVEEDINWYNYYQNKSEEEYLPDTTPFRRRGLVKIQGEEQYREVGQIIGKDLVGNPTTVASDNQTHVSASETDDQVENSIAVSIWYFKNKTTQNFDTFENKSGIPSDNYKNEYQRIKSIVG